MQERRYREWLVAQDYDSGTITAQLHRSMRVEKYYGDLEKHYRHDRLKSVVQTLVYSSEDERRQRPNPSKIPLDRSANIRNNLASYRDAVNRYARFLENAGASVDWAEATEATNSAEVVIEPIVVVRGEPDDSLQKIGLERDMQSALRRNIADLEVGLVIADNGMERTVESGRIDITAKDTWGRTVVIELKAGAAGQRAVAQILSYMGDVSAEEPDGRVRGILIASEFDAKALAAARMVPSLELVTYGVKFHFDKL